MTGIPQFNFPAFFAAAKELRDVHGLDIVSPAEIDDEEDAGAALASPDGAPGSGTGACNDKTWGDFLARDVKLIADVCGGIVFLPRWEKSRGARLEAFVGILCGVDFGRYVPGVGIEAMNPKSVLAQLTRETHGSLS
jgi:hypothetical protein